MGALLVVVTLAVSGCGSASSSTSQAHSPTKTGASPEGPVTQGSGVPAAATAVIKGWADALRNGQARRAAAYWAHPSAMINGPDSHGLLSLVRIRTERDALAADETLSCGATLRSTTHSGVYVLAEFSLGARSGGAGSASGCSGPARVDFLIRHAKIVRWIRAPLSGPPTGGEAGSSAGAGQSI